VSEQGGEQFGHVLRRMRSDYGLSQEALSERSGVSVRGISDLERGQRRVPRLETIRLLADALGLDQPARAELIAASRPHLYPSSARPGSSSVDLGAAGTNDGDTYRSNLPPQPTPLIGRGRETLEVIALLRQPNTRWVSLTGPGGIGKTRLAVQAGTELIDEFPDGVWFVPLAALSDADLVIPAIADVLGVRESGGASLRTMLIAYLREKMLLLLLDNFEHVAEAAADVNELLASCANVKVLVTSSVALRLRVEQIHAVAPLAWPEPGALPSVEDIDQYDALALFVDRARRVDASFAVSSDSIPDISLICERLDGLPLAIELAAARARLLSLRDLSALLQHSLPILTGGDRDLPLRHQTLRNTIAWSYDLLGDDDRRLFRRLAVFAGSWTLESAQAVVGDVPFNDPRADMLDRLEVLVDHSLVRRVDHPGHDSRFGMLGIIREFGLEQLSKSDEEEDIRQRHARYILSFTEQQRFDSDFRNEADRLKRIDLEYDNVRTALGWLLDQRHAVMALSLCSELRTYWGMRGYLSEGRRWLDAALAIEDATTSAVRARALNAASWLACHQGDMDEADRLASESLALSRERADDTGVASALHALGLTAQLRDEYRQASDLYEQCLELKRLIHDPTLATTLGNLAQVEFHQGNVERSIDLFDECIALDHQTGNAAHLGTAMTDLGLIMRERGDDERADELFTEALRIHHEIGHARMVASTIEGMATLAARRRHPERAARLLGAVEALRETIAYPRDDSDRWHCTHYVTLAREQTDDATFSAAWADGRTMPMERAIHYALTDDSKR
jgi:predicted ATPase/transcriptional regulator with XRE-family HTH domain